jgi:hypothetical protein
MRLARRIATYTSLYIQVNASEGPSLFEDERISSEIFNKFHIIQLVKNFRKIRGIESTKKAVKICRNFVEFNDHK